MQVIKQYFLYGLIILITEIPKLKTCLPLGVGRRMPSHIELNRLLEPTIFDIQTDCIFIFCIVFELKSLLNCIV